MMKQRKLFVIMSLYLTVGFLITFIPDFSVSAKKVTGTILQLTINEAIGPATDDYIKRALATARQRNVKLIVIQMDTPGGLDTAMRGIIKNITNSEIPVASYVAPTGARAASAGTYILYASHIAAMAPGTNLGAATPIKIGGLPMPDKPDKNKNDKADGKFIDDPMKHKMINDAVAYIRSLAQLHNRNQDWAEKAVREAASLPASEALKLNVINIKATDVADLLQQLNGREVLVLGKKHSLHTTGLIIEKMDPDWRNKFLSVITNPNIAYILMLIGIYGLIFEFSNPGSIVPGTVGAIALLLALYSFQLLPINYAGMALLLLGIALMVGEALQPSFGILGIGGMVAFVIGSIILIDTDSPDFLIDTSIIITFTIISALIFIFVIGMAIKSHHRKVVSGLEELIGATATVINDFNQNGRVTIHSENWKAHTNIPLLKDQHVKVTAVNGLTLQVEPLIISTQEEES